MGQIILYCGGYTVLCRCLAVSLASSHWRPVAPLSHNDENKNCLQTLQNIPRQELRSGKFVWEPLIYILDSKPQGIMDLRKSSQFQNKESTVISSGCMIPRAFSDFSNSSPLLDLHLLLPWSVPHVCSRSIPTLLPSPFTTCSSAVLFLIIPSLIKCILSPPAPHSVKVN